MIGWFLGQNSSARAEECQKGNQYPEVPWLAGLWGWRCVRHGRMIGWDAVLATKPPPPVRRPAGRRLRKKPPLTTIIYVRSGVATAFGLVIFRLGRIRIGRDLHIGKNSPRNESACLPEGCPIIFAPRRGCVSPAARASPGAALGSLMRSAGGGTARVGQPLLAREHRAPG